MGRDGKGGRGGGGRGGRGGGRGGKYGAGKGEKFIDREIRELEEAIEVGIHRRLSFFFLFLFTAAAADIFIAPPLFLTYIPPTYPYWYWYTSS